MEVQDFLTRKFHKQLVYRFLHVSKKCLEMIQIYGFSEKKNWEVLPKIK